MFMSGVWFLWSKKKSFSKRKWKYFYTFNHSFRENSSKRANSTNHQVWPLICRNNLRSTQSDLTPRILTLTKSFDLNVKYPICLVKQCNVGYSPFLKELWLFLVLKCTTMCHVAKWDTQKLWSKTFLTMSLNYTVSFMFCDCAEFLSLYLFKIEKNNLTQAAKTSFEFTLSKQFLEILRKKCY